MRNFSSTVFILSILLSLLYLGSCRQDDFDTSPDVQLKFSVDSLLFDTVFTTLGTSTRSFRVYNTSNSRVRIDMVNLKSGSQSYFRINADGRSGQHIQDLEIAPGDSMFVFVEVTLDPANDDLPLIVTEQIVFHLGGGQQKMDVVAWGQDAHFIHPNIIDTVNNISYHLIAEDTHWQGPKPYVIYGLALVAPGVTLQVDQGARVHFHNNSALIFLGESTFKVEGTLEEPIVFQGDRLEASYQNRPAQWGYIWLTATSKNHQIDYAIIKNGTYGLIMDSIGSYDEPSLQIRNTIIKNMDQTGLELNGSFVTAENMLIANCGLHALHLQFGGNYDFRNITIANYYNTFGGFRQTPSVVFNNYFVDTTNTVNVREFENVYFGNSIIYGGLQEEIGMDLYPDASVADFLFDHCLISTQMQQQSPLFNECIFNQTPQFVSIDGIDFRLKENSPVIGRGNPNISIQIPYDILGNSREDGVDLGAYQYYDYFLEDD